jgi:hypothetical protein
MSGATSSPKPAITSPYAPDLERVRAWLEKKIAAALFVEIVAAILALLGRMRDINLELARKVAHMQRRRSVRDARATPAPARLAALRRAGRKAQARATVDRSRRPSWAR